MHNEIWQKAILACFVQKLVSSVCICSIDSDNLAVRIEMKENYICWPSKITQLKTDESKNATKTITGVSSASRIFKLQVATKCDSDHHSRRSKRGTTTSTTMNSSSKMIIDQSTLFLSLKDDWDEVNLNGDSNRTPVNESPKRWVIGIFDTNFTHKSTRHSTDIVGASRNISCKMHLKVQQKR